MMDIKEHIKKRHLKRRMFAIVQNKLIIAKPYIPDSHLDWFKKDKIIKNDSDPFFDKIVRGVVKENRIVWFYFGREFLVDKKAEDIFFKHLIELIKIMNIPESGIIWGGKIKKDVSEGDWPARRIYGSIKECKNLFNL